MQLAGAGTCELELNGNECECSVNPPAPPLPSEEGKKTYTIRITYDAPEQQAAPIAPQTCQKTEVHRMQKEKELILKASPLAHRAPAHRGSTKRKSSEFQFHARAINRKPQRHQSSLSSRIISHLRQMAAAQHLLAGSDDADAEMEDDAAVDPSSAARTLDLTRAIASLPKRHSSQTSRPPPDSAAWAAWPPPPCPESTAADSGSTKHPKAPTPSAHELAIALQQAHNSSPSRGDKSLQERLDEKEKLREGVAARRVERERMRDEEMVVGAGVRGIAALVAARRGAGRR